MAVKPASDQGIRRFPASGPSVQVTRRLALVLIALALVQVPLAVALRNPAFLAQLLLLIPAVLLWTWPRRNWVEIGPDEIVVATNGRVRRLARNAIDRALVIEVIARSMDVGPTIVVLGNDPAQFVRIHRGVHTDHQLAELLQLLGRPVEQAPGQYAERDFAARWPQFTTAEETTMLFWQRWGILIAVGLFFGAVALLTVLAVVLL